MSDTIPVIDWDAVIQEEQVAKNKRKQVTQNKRKQETLYNFVVGEHDYDVRVLSFPNQFQFFRPDYAQIDLEKMKEFLNQYLEYCIQYMYQDTIDSSIQDTIDSSLDFYEYTAQLDESENSVSVHTFENRDPMKQIMKVRKRNTSKL